MRTGSALAAVAAAGKSNREAAVEEDMRRSMPEGVAACSPAVVEVGRGSTPVAVAAVEGWELSLWSRMWL